MLTPRSLLLVAVTAAAAQGLVGQTTSFVAPKGHGYDTAPGVMPITAGFSANPTVSSFVSRAQVVFHTSALGFSKGSISQIDFRRDAVDTQSYAALQRSAFSVTFNYTPIDPKNLPFRFSAVTSGAGTIAFSGNVNLPAAPYMGPVAHPWSVPIMLNAPWSFDAVNGNLVVDLTSDGMTPAPWAADAHWDYSDGIPGSETMLAKGCTASNGLAYSVMRNLLQVATGRTIRLLTYGIPRNVNLVTSLVGVRLPTPIKLAGTPDCLVALNPICNDTRGAYFEGGNNFNCASVEYTIPDNPFLVGQTFSWQFGFVDPAANPLGVVSSDSYEFTLGQGPSHQYGVQTNIATFPGLDFADQAGAEFGPIIRFTGTLQ